MVILIFANGLGFFHTVLIKSNLVDRIISPAKLLLFLVFYFLFYFFYLSQARLNLIKPT